MRIVYTRPTKDEETEPGWRVLLQTEEREVGAIDNGGMIHFVHSSFDLNRRFATEAATTTPNNRDQLSLVFFKYQRTCCCRI